MYMNNLLEADGLAYFGARANGLYLCMPCDVQFNYSLGHTDCPVCHTEGRDELAALYIEHDAETAEMVQPCNFTGGD